MSRISKFFRRLIQSQSLLNLKDEAPVLLRRVDALKSDPDHSNLHERLLTLKADLDKALKEEETQQGWKIFKEIRRTLIYAMTKEELKSKAQTVLSESKSKTKESPWRLLVIKEVLEAKDEDKSGLRSDLHAAHVVRATEILDEHQDNFYEKLETLRRRIRTLSWATFLALFIWVMLGPTVGEFPYMSELSNGELTATKKAIDEMAKKVANTSNKIDSLAKEKEKTPPKPSNKTPLSSSDSLKNNKPSAVPDSNRLIPKTLDEQSNPSSEHKNETNKTLKNTAIDSLSCNSKCCADGTRDLNKNPRLLAFLIILTGIIGAVVSGFIRTINTGLEDNIPDQIFGTTILTARLMLASVAALAIYIFLGTGVILLFGSKTSFELLLAFAFVAGFSEQLVQRGVEALNKQELYNSKDKPGK